MKFFAFILSVWILSLNFIPCSDAETNASEEKIGQCADAEKHSDALDLCSPFCQCHCCHLHTLNFQVSEIELYNPEIFKSNFSNFEKNVKNFGSGMLQPPRI